MADIVKLNNVATANFSKVNNVEKANFSKIAGQSLSTPYVSANSVLFDGTNDYAKVSGLNFPSDVGSISLWFKFNNKTGTQRLFSWNNYSTSSSYNNFIDLSLVSISGNPVANALYWSYRSTINGTSVDGRCSDKISSAHHATGWSRWKYSYQGFSSNSTWQQFEYNAKNYLSTGNNSGWHQVVITWDVNETYTAKDAQAAHKYRPTLSHDSTTTTRTGTMRLYMDGVLKNFGQSPYPSYNYQKTPSSLVEITETLDEIYIGALSAASSHFKGNIDDVAVFDAQLDDDAVAAMYNSGTPIDLTSNSGNYDNSNDLIGYWKFDEGTGTSIADSSSNSNAATLNNSPSWDNGDAP